MEIAADLIPSDPLKFKDSKRYKERISQAQKLSGEKEALVVMRGQLKGMDLVAVAFEFNFMGGSMGSVVGEKFVQESISASNTAFPSSVFPPVAVPACRSRCSR